MNRPLGVSTLLVLLATAAGCGSDADESSDSTLTVLGAASLQSTFEEVLGPRFEDSHPGVTIKFSFAGSSDLSAQIDQGAEADVFASADAANMDKIDYQVDNRVDFASNTLQIAVPPDNPASVSAFADLTSPDVNVVVCAPEVPCGAAAVKIEEATGEQIDPVSEEASVTDVLNKVVTGEADAGLVYVTDVQAAGSDVRGVPFDESDEAVNVYPIATLADSANAGLAKDFVDLVTSDEGQQALSDAGFARP